MAQQESARSYGWVWTAVILAAGIGLFTYLKMRNTIVTVTASTVQRQDLSRDVSTNGKVAPLEDFQAHAPLAGIVKKLFVHLGENVRAGEELVQMDDSEARKDLASAEATLLSSMASLKAMQQGGTQDEQLTANADLSTAQTQVQQDKTALASLQTLRAQGAASDNEIAVAQQRLTAAQAKVNELQTRKTGRYATDDLSAQRAQVAQARAAVDAAKTVFNGVDIRAPFAGTVYAVPVTQYEFVPTGETLIQVADLTKLEVKAYFDEPEIGGLKAGQPVTISWDAKPNQSWHGHVIQAPTTIIAYGGTRNVGECLISVDDAKGDLLPNTNVTVKVTELSKHDVLSIPREALHAEALSNFVYRIVHERLVRTPVEVGVVSVSRVEITGGLSQGDVVALGATSEQDLSDGLHVKVQPQ
jgi:HlyD family secretion protein